MRTVYAYYLKSESGDEYLEISETDYSDIEFMKVYAPSEYQEWKDLSYEDNEIPYDSFIKTQYDLE